MIAQLTGTPIFTNTPHELIIDVAGVGYGVFVSPHTLSMCHDKKQVTLYIYTHLTEHALELFGFSSQAEKHIFLLLLNISGVGPKTALALSDLGAHTLTRAVQEADTTIFTSTPRVGKKLAQKIIIELKSKLGSIKELDLRPLSSMEEDIVLALESLGFKRESIEKVVKSLNLEEHSTQSAVTQALRLLSQ